MKSKAASFSMPFVLALFGACNEDSPRPTPGPGPIAPPTVTDIPAPPAPPPSSDPLVGTYRLTLNIGADCASVPESARNHSYTATIEHRNGSMYTVTLGDGRFLTGLICDLPSAVGPGLGCNQFLASEAGGEVTFQLINNNDDAHGGHIVTQTSAGEWLEIIGDASARPEGGSIRAGGTASVWFCGAASAYPFPCPRPVSCDDAGLKMEFTRQR